MADEEKGTGRWLGLPYDWRRPTGSRLQERWWNPDAPLFTPKAWGWGYDINLGWFLRFGRGRD